MADHDLIEQYQEMHKNPKRFLGYTSTAYADEIAKLVEDYHAQTLLDYGCGKGLQYLVKRVHERWGILPHCYDPGWPPLAKRPKGTFSGVICTDVLEHVPETKVRGVLHDLFSYAEKFVFMAISVSGSSKKLPDGRDCHLTVKRPVWWDNEIDAVASAYPEIVHRAVFRDGSHRVD